MDGMDGIMVGYFGLWIFGCGFLVVDFGLWMMNEWMDGWMDGWMEMKESGGGER